MGVSFESWIFFTVIIMANCYRQEDTKDGSFFEKIRQPLICAAKVFVFFLISQPLIYLFEVPFSEAFRVLYLLVQVDAGDHSYGVHRLVHQ